MVGEFPSKLGLEFYKPVLSCPHLHGVIVLPVNVDTVHVVIQDEGREAVCSCHWVLSSSGWELGSPESRNQKFYSFVVVHLFEFLLDCLSVSSQKAHGGTCCLPYLHKISSVTGHPER